MLGTDASARNIPEQFTSEKVEVVAEIGVNHDGSLEKAKRLVISARDSGADFIKTQTFSPDLLALRSTPKVRYQKERDSSGSHYEMLSHLVLPHSDQERLHDFCLSEGIGFFSTPYDPSQVPFLAGLGVPYLKVSSADIIDLELLEMIAQTGIPAIISTGMASLQEIHAALRILEFGYAETTVLHAVSMYPTEPKALRLRSILELKELLRVRVGFSDHSEGFLAGSVAVAMGATMVEKHFTLDKRDSGPDHAASADPKTFAKMVQTIREAELMSGKLSWTLTPEELDMRNTSRKSLVSACEIPTNSVLEKRHFVALRPGDGIPVNLLSKFLGRTTRRTIPAGSKFQYDDFR